MTNREICERLMEIRDYARVTDTWPHDNAAQQNLHLRNAVEAIAKDLGELLLDLAAPDDHFADAGKMMREEEKSAKEPPVLIYEENGHAWEVCPACGGGAFPILNKPGTFRCKRCGGFFNAKEGK